MLSVGEEVVRSWPLSLESRSKNFLPSKKQRSTKRWKAEREITWTDLREVKFPEKKICFRFWIGLTRESSAIPTVNYRFLIISPVARADHGWRLFAVIFVRALALTDVVIKTSRTIEPIPLLNLASLFRVSADGLRARQQFPSTIICFGAAATTEFSADREFPASCLPAWRESKRRRRGWRNAGLCIANSVITRAWDVQAGGRWMIMSWWPQSAPRRRRNNHDPLRQLLISYTRTEIAGDVTLSRWRISTIGLSSPRRISGQQLTTKWLR